MFQVLYKGDPTSTIIDPSFTPEQREKMLAEFGLDQPTHFRYIRYIQNIMVWNFGLSFASRQSVAAEMSWRLVYSVLLLGSALVATIMVGIPLGIFAASRRGSKLDVASIGAGLFAWGVPTFFIQLLFQLFFAYYIVITFGVKLFPLIGAVSDPTPTDPLIFMADLAWHLALPLITLTIAGFGSWALYTRNVLLDALTQDFIVTARAKGLNEKAVLYKHAFRSVLPPIATMVTLSVPGIVTGAMITEIIFTWPGIGHWYFSSLTGHDYPVVQAVLFVYAVLMVAANLVADIVYGVLDPRIRVGMRR